MAPNTETESAMPSILQRMITVRKDTPHLVEKQKTDAALGVIRRELLEGKRGPGGGGYVVDNADLLWITSTGQLHAWRYPEPPYRGWWHSYAAPLPTWGWEHSGVGRTTDLVNQRFYWPILLENKSK